MVPAEPPPTAPQLGLRANWRQFWLFVLINAFVGAMVGLERTVVPLLGEQVFGIEAGSALLAFIASFGLTKAFANLWAGHLADHYGRKRILVIGWLIGLPVPIILIFAPSWGWVVAANVLLGLNQGLCWSMNILSKIDLVGPKRRGLAMGLNEFAGYAAVGLTALATGYIASAYGLRPYPFLLGIAFALLGLGLSAGFARETLQFAHHEADQAGHGAVAREPMVRAFLRNSWGDRSLVATNQAGLVNNLNDGVAWGLFPLLFASSGLDTASIGTLVAAYPLCWGVAQIATGALSDRVGRKWLIAAGMVLQGAALYAVATSNSYRPWLGASIALGLGTALVYPTLLSAVSGIAGPRRRGSAVGAYRFWRDSGYVVGALGVGAAAGTLGIAQALVLTAALTAGSGIVVAVLMREPKRVAP